MLINLTAAANHIQKKKKKEKKERKRNFDNIEKWLQ